MSESNQNNALIPGAIVIAGLIVAGAIFFTQGGTVKTPEEQPTAAAQEGQQADPSKVLPVSGDDHVFGNPDAEIFIVEYSDFECPFCSRLHGVLEDVVEQYDGKVAWVYRHLPLQNHPKALPLAQTSECVAEIGGNDAFWTFTGGIFAGQDSDALIASIGVDAGAVASCVEEGRYLERIKEHEANAVATGGRGTPWSIIIDSEGNTLPVSGAQPITVWQGIIDPMLGQ